MKVHLVIVTLLACSAALVHPNEVSICEKFTYFDYFISKDVHIDLAPIVGSGPYKTKMLIGNIVFNITFDICRGLNISCPNSEDIHASVCSGNRAFSCATWGEHDSICLGKFDSHTIKPLEEQNGGVVITSGSGDINSGLKDPFITKLVISCNHSVNFIKSRNIKAIHTIENGAMIVTISLQHSSACGKIEDEKKSVSGGFVSFIAILFSCIFLLVGVLLGLFLEKKFTISQIGKRYRNDDYLLLDNQKSEIAPNEFAR